MLVSVAHAVVVVLGIKSFLGVGGKGQLVNHVRAVVESEHRRPTGGVLTVHGEESREVVFVPKEGLLEERAGMKDLGRRCN